MIVSNPIRDNVQMLPSAKWWIKIHVSNPIRDNVQMKTISEEVRRRGFKPYKG